MGFEEIFFIFGQSLFRIPSDVRGIGLSGAPGGELKHHILERLQFVPGVFRGHCGNLLCRFLKMALNRRKVRGDKFPFQQMLPELNRCDKILCLLLRSREQKNGGGEKQKRDRFFH